MSSTTKQQLIDKIIDSCDNPGDLFEDLHLDIWDILERELESRTEDQLLKLL